MKRGQLLIALLAVAAVGLVAVLAGGSGGGDEKKKDSASRSAPAQAPGNAVVVSFAYSPEKEKLLVPLVREFNAQQTHVGGRPVFVRAQNVSSGDAEARIARGTYKPVAWSPSSSLWGRLLNFEADRALTPDESPSLVRTPLVIAMWEPMARALGWPKKRLGFADVLKLADDPRGWAAYGHPEYGAFRLVHTNPAVSTSGLEAVVGEHYAATGKLEGLTVADVERPDVQRKIAGIEQSIVHYGDATPFIEEQLRKHGPSYASAVAMEETTLIDFNRNRGGQPKLVAVYPAGGTFYSDSPFIIL